MVMAGINVSESWLLKIAEIGLIVVGTMYAVQWRQEADLRLIRAELTTTQAQLSEVKVRLESHQEKSVEKLDLIRDQIVNHRLYDHPKVSH